jgi:cytochrome d ubiquinol oxidase subunit II
MSPDLPLIWAGLLALTVLIYVLLDGFDLGIGILFAFARAPADRDRMMSAIAPVWDGNETWLVMGGAGLMVAFPAAYALLLPALYLPVMAMLGGLILRGVAFEFRLHGKNRGKRVWTIAFAGGSLIATLAQGLVLGGFMQGIKAKGEAFAGGPFDWLSGYSLLVACGLVAGYALLGAGWLMLKTEDPLHGDARRWALIAATATGVLLAAVSLLTPVIHPLVAQRWGLFADHIELGRLASLSPIPLLGLIGLALAVAGVRTPAHRATLIGGWLLFLSGYLGLAVGFLPYVAPYALTFRQAASTDGALGLMLAGAVVLLPFNLAYTVWIYWLFRGKVLAPADYH